jgi:hypothetical protein
MAADAAAAVSAQILEELASEVDMAGGAERGSRARRIRERQAVRERPELRKLRDANALLVGHQAGR